MEDYKECKEMMRKIRRKINKKFPELKNLTDINSKKLEPKTEGYLGKFLLMGDSTILRFLLGRTELSIHYIERIDFLVIEQEGLLFEPSTIKSYIRGAIDEIEDMQIVKDKIGKR